MKKVYFLLLIIIAAGTTNVNAQLLQWNTFTNLGTETTEPSVFNNANIAAANLTQGTITPAANGNRFGGSGWFNTGNTAGGNTLAEAVAGNDYIQFIVTPNAGFSFTPTSFVFVWDRSGTGPANVTLRSSADGFTTDLGTVSGIVGAAFATNTITISGLTNITTATTFRLYGYGASATGGTGGFDIASNVVNVQLNGTTAAAGGSPTKLAITSINPASPTVNAPFSVTVQAQDGTSTPANVVANTDVTLSVTTGTGVLGGTVTGTILAGTNNIVIPNLTYNVAENGVVLTATRTAGDVLTPGNSAPFNVLPAASQLVLVGVPVAGIVNSNLTTFTVEARRPDNSVDNTYTGSITINKVSGPGNVVGTVTVAAVAGVATFSAVQMDAIGVYTINATDGTLTSATSGNIVITAPIVYTWIGVTGGAWTTSTNWLPTRGIIDATDVLQFIDGLTYTVTSVPTETIAQLLITNGTKVTLQASSASTLTIVGATGTDLDVSAGGQLNSDGASAITMNLGAAATGVINGSMTFTGGGHRLTAASASGITFNSGSTFTAGLAMTGNPFGAGTANSVVFTSGSTFTQIAGSNPFSLGAPASIVVFQTGSLFRLAAALTPSVSGRTYANFEANFTGSVSATGAALLTMDNITVTNGTMTFGMTTAGMNVKGNVTVAPGATLAFAPLTLGVVTFNGTAAQTITNNGTLTYGPFQSLTINNAAGVSLNSNITLGATATLTLTSGILKLNTPATMISLSAGTTLAGTPSNTAFIDGKVRKIGNTAFTFPVGKTGFGYVPIGISNFSGGAVTNEFAAEYIRGSARQLGAVTAAFIDHVSGCDYWTLDLLNGTPTVDLTAYWSPANGCNGTYIDDLTKLEIAHFNGTVWDNSSWGFSSVSGGSTVVAGDITWAGVNTFSPFSLASTTLGVNALPITLNYLNGYKQGSTHALNWKVTCNTSPSVTMVMERSTDGRNYNSIYSISATALQCQSPFNYTDAQPAPGINYYRLKLTDADGKITYSTVVSLINATKGFDVMNIAPNPIVNGNFKLNVSAAQKAQMDIMITDMQGRVMQRQSISLIAGFNAIPMNVTKLSSGTYQVYGITEDGRSRVLRFVIQ